jgi:hypothetical protein
MEAEYTRTYVQSDPTSDPERRRFQVGEEVYFRSRRRRTEPRKCRIVSLDRKYARRQLSGQLVAVDSFYTIEFVGTGRLRRAVASGELRRDPRKFYLFYADYLYCEAEYDLNPLSEEEFNALT